LPDEAKAPHDKLPRAVVLGCAGERLTPEEGRLFAAADPLGFILFRRNCRNRGQLRELVAELRRCIGRDDAPVLVDQEGGRVARLQPPEWRAYPAAARIAALPDPLAAEAAWLGARLIADDLAEVGITVDCAPVLDLPVPGADPVIGDRAFGDEPARVALLGRAFCEGLLAGGVLPVLKHIPGHGRARVDSHRACPRVETGRAVLVDSDFAPFRALSTMPWLEPGVMSGPESGAMPWAMPWAMTGHIVFKAIDETAPATFSRPVIDTIIRGEIGFHGVLLSDDISMGALDGTLGGRTRRALDAGCDLVLHGSGVIDEMSEIIDAAAPLSPAAWAQIAHAEALRQSRRQDFDRQAPEVRFAEMFASPDPNRARA
jgi:beta-N-acetylhexosaminidase